MHFTGLVKLDDPDAKIKFLAAEALEEIVVLSLTALGHLFANKTTLQEKVVYGQCVTYTCDPCYAHKSEETCRPQLFSCRAPESCSPVLCNKPEFENVERSTVSVGCHEEVSRFQWISLGARI